VTKIDEHKNLYKKGIRKNAKLNKRISKKIETSYDYIVNINIHINYIRNIILHFKVFKNLLKAPHNTIFKRLYRLPSCLRLQVR
jgi:hypothetical protein